MDPDTGYVVAANSYRNLKKEWQAHRKGNDLPHDNVEDWIHEKICAAEPVRCQESVIVGGKVAAEPSYPALMEMGFNFLSSHVKWLRKGAKLAPKEVIERRLATCRSCSYWNESNGRCTKCGCYGKWKVLYATEKCPVRKWVEV